MVFREKNNLESREKIINECASNKSHSQQQQQRTETWKNLKRNDC